MEPDPPPPAEFEYAVEPAIVEGLKEALKHLEENPKMGLNVITKLINHHPQSSVLYYHKARCFISLMFHKEMSYQKHEYLMEALTANRRALELSPRSLWFALGLIRNLRALKLFNQQFSGVIEECQRALSIKNPTDPGVDEGLSLEEIASSTKESRIEEVVKEINKIHREVSEYKKKLLEFDIDGEIDQKLVGRHLHDIKMRMSKIESNKTLDFHVKQKFRKNGEESVSLRDFWSNEMSEDERKKFLVVTIEGLLKHLKSSEVDHAVHLCQDAMEFAKTHSGIWKFIQCWVCLDKFVDCESYRNHFWQEHMHEYVLLDIVEDGGSDGTELLPIEFRSMNFKLTSHMGPEFKENITFSSDLSALVLDMGLDESRAAQVSWLYQDHTTLKERIECWCSVRDSHKKKSSLVFKDILKECLYLRQLNNKLNNNLKEKKKRSYLSFLTVTHSNVLHKYQQQLEELSTYDYKFFMLPMLKSLLKLHLQEIFFTRSSIVKDICGNKTETPKKKKKNKKKKKKKEEEEEQNFEKKTDVGTDSGVLQENLENPRSALFDKSPLNKYLWEFYVNAVRDKGIEHLKKYMLLPDPEQLPLIEISFEDIKKAVSLSTECFYKNIGVPTDISEDAFSKSNIIVYVVIQSLFRLRSLGVFGCFRGISEAHYHSSAPCMSCIVLVLEGLDKELTVAAKCGLLPGNYEVPTDMMCTLPITHWNQERIEGQAGAPFQIEETPLSNEIKEKFVTMVVAICKNYSKLLEKPESQIVATA